MHQYESREILLQCVDLTSGTVFSQVVEALISILIAKHIFYHLCYYFECQARQNLSTTTVRILEKY